MKQVAASEMKNPVAYFAALLRRATDIYVGNLAVRLRCCSGAAPAAAAAAAAAELLPV